MTSLFASQRLGSWCAGFAVWALICSSLLSRANTDHTVYFQNTDHELHVYEVLGQRPGETVLIIGGMHNEPGGYVSADRYADFSLKKGRLIVVPRANLPVIVTNNRQIHVDMNRTFGNGTQAEVHKHEYEASVAEILKSLISRSDVLLHLHDGYGFYRPAFETALKNPKRWGQSIITDTDRFGHTNGKILELGKRVDRVLSKVNPRIENQEHRFHHHNTRTLEPDSPPPEQKNSATFYALSECGIEAYGIETSRNIESLNLKVHYQTLVVNAFLDEFGIIPSDPGVVVHEPRLQYLLVKVNESSYPFGIPAGETLEVQRGDRIQIEHIAANYERGLVADVQGLGSLNDPKKELVIDRERTILVKKDQFECGRIFLAVKDKPRRRRRSRTIEAFRLRLNNQTRQVPAGATLAMSPSDILVLDDVEPRQDRPLRVNFVGFVGKDNLRSNNGEDRGYEIRSKDLWVRRSLDKKGGLYQVKAVVGKSTLAEFFVRVQPESEP